MSVASRLRAIERAIRRLAPALLLAAWPGLGVSAAELAGHGGPVRAVAVTTTGTIVSGGFDTSLLVRRGTGDPAPRRVQAHDKAINAIARSADGRSAVSVGDDGFVMLLDLAAAEPVRRIELGQKLVAVDIDPSGRIAAVGGFGDAVYLVDLESGTRIGELEHRGERSTALRFLDGDTLVGAGHQGGLRRWQTSTGELVLQRPGNGQAITDLVRLHGGQLATSDIGGRIRLWDEATLQQVGDLLEQDRPFLALAASSDGKRLAAGDAAGRILVWDLPARQPIRLVNAHRGPVWDLAFVPPSGELISAGSDGVLRVWTGRGGGPELADVKAPEPEAAGPGERLFRKCVACHTVTPDGGNRAGPTLHGLFGRPAGRVEGYVYSEALASSHIVWDATTVGQLFELGPDVVVPGTKMPIQRIPDAAERAALLAYLRTITIDQSNARPPGPEGTRP